MWVNTNTLTWELIHKVTWVNTNTLTDVGAHRYSYMSLH